MFGRTITQYRNTPYEKEVHEHRAPTDDSIRIYEECMQKARASYAGSVKVDNTELDVKVVLYEDTYAIDGLKALVKAKVNGVEYEQEYTSSRYEFDEHEIIEQFYTEIVQGIVAKELREVLFTRHEYKKINEYPAPNGAGINFDKEAE